MKKRVRDPARMVILYDGTGRLPDVPWGRVTKPTLFVFLSGASGREQTLTRRQLYQLVFSMPMVYAADEVGIGRKKLASLCDLLGVPKPGRGYWQKVQADKKPRRPRLAKRHDGPTHVVFRRRGFRRVLGDALVDKAEHLRAAEAEPSSRIDVPKNPGPDDLHEQVRRTAERLDVARTDHYGRQSLKGTPACLDVRVGRATVPRAVAVLDALVKALEARGFPVHSHHYRGRVHTTADILGVSVRWRLVEQTSRQPPVGGNDALDESPCPRSVGDTFLPDVGLRLEVLPEGTAARYMGRFSWCDGKPNHTVESLLNGFVGGLISAALATRYVRAKREQRDREYMERIRKEQEALFDSYREIDERS